MGYIAGEDRGQGSFLPARLDDYVGPASLVRLIDGFIAPLDLKRLAFVRAVSADTGRPGYDPRDLLRLYVWGYLNEVRSSRKLERECGRNVEVMWLMGRLAPDHKTIADFRRDNGAGIVKTSEAFVTFCREQGLLGRVAAVDGSKFRAAASPRRVLGVRAIERQTQRIDAKVAAYLAALDAADAAEAADEQITADHARVAAALAALLERRGELAALSIVLETGDRTTLVEGESEARALKLGSRRMLPVYNVQTAVDARSGLIVHHDVVDSAGDNRQLLPMALAAQAALGGGAVRVIADAGYSNGAQAAACEHAGIEPCVPANRSTGGTGGRFGRDAFQYQADRDAYVCPAGHAMRRTGFNKRDQLYSYGTKACPTCPLKAQCTTGKHRSVSRHRHEDALARMNARVEADPGLMRLRGCVAEPPFGTIKRMMAGGRMLMRGLANAATEIALSVLAYNIRRFRNLNLARA